MTKHSIDFSYFLESLETFENLLHAETQAIAAKHLDTIEEIIDRKDEGLRLLLDSKGKLGNHGDEASCDEGGGGRSLPASTCAGDTERGTASTPRTGAKAERR